MHIAAWTPPTAPDLKLSHTADRSTDLDHGDHQYHRVRLLLEGGDDDLDRVTRVVYHLHPTFAEPDVTVTAPETRFELAISVWGTFTVTADVHLRDRPAPVLLRRFLSL